MKEYKGVSIPEVDDLDIPTKEVHNTTTIKIGKSSITVPFSTNDLISSKTNTELKSTINLAIYESATVLIDMHVIN